MAITYVKIGTASGTGSSTDLTISGISGAYDDLIIRTSMRSTYAIAQRDNMSLFFNGNTTVSNYYRSEYWTEDDAYGVENKINNNTQMGTSTAALAVANLYSAGEIYIPSYSSSGNEKIAQSRLVQSNRDTSSTKWTDWNAFLRYLFNQDPITSITLRAGNGNWVSGAKINLYGIKNS